MDWGVAGIDALDFADLDWESFSFLLFYFDLDSERIMVSFLFCWPLLFVLGGDVELLTYPGPEPLTALSLLSLNFGLATSLIYFSFDFEFDFGY